MTTRKTWSTEEKLQIVLESLHPRANVSEICRHHGISSTTFYEWKQRALAGMKVGLQNREGSAETALRPENVRLKKLRGRPQHRQRRREFVRQMQERGISSLSRAARFSGLARHGLYYHPHPNSPRPRRPDEGRARAAVRRMALNHVTYGHRRVWAVLRRDGWTINRKRVHRLMRVEGLLRPAHFPRPRLPSTGVLTAAWPNEKWYTDLTYIDTTDRGPCPLTSILDGCTRKVAAWSFLPNCGAEEALEVLVTAVSREFPETLRADGLVVRADAGSQFIAHRFREGAKVLGIQVEAIRKKRPEDNGMIGSYHGHLKMDYLWVTEPTSFTETRELLTEALRHYNEERPHSSLDYLTPIEYEKKKQEEAKA